MHRRALVAAPREVCALRYLRVTLRRYLFLCVSLAIGAGAADRAHAQSVPTYQAAGAGSVASGRTLDVMLPLPPLWVTAPVSPAVGQPPWLAARPERVWNPELLAES